jgi:hypothetical protein
VPAEGVDRLKLYFGAPRAGEDNNLYALHIEITTDRGETLDVGRFVLGVPTLVNRTGIVLPESDYLLDFPESGEAAASTWCFRHNLAEMRRVLAKPGARAPEIQELRQLQVAKKWPAYADGHSARAGAEALLRNRNITAAPALAVFAAERTSDDVFVELIRQRAVRLLLRRAERFLLPLENLPTEAIADSRAAFWLSDSSVAREVVARAESGERELEEASE